MPTARAARWAAARPAAAWRSRSSSRSSRRHGPASPPRTALAPPSPEARRQLSCKSVDLESGEAKERGGKVITECFRVDAKGRTIDTQTRLVSGDGARAGRDRDDASTPARRGSLRSALRACSPASRRPTVAVQAVPQWGDRRTCRSRSGRPRHSANAARSVRDRRWPATPRGAFPVYRWLDSRDPGRPELQASHIGETNFNFTGNQASDAAG
jgi:hypothetical protein